MHTRSTFADILSARRAISPYVSRTPLRHYPSLSDALGAEVYLKHENYQVTGAFKVRGGINLVSRLSEEDKARGIICASTGNHGQSIAYAGRLFGVRAIIVVPEGANPGKVEAMRDFGAEVIFHGADFDESREHVERLCAEFGYRYIHSGNEPDLIAGVGTYAVEIIEDLPDVEVIFVPVGGGSGACGTAIAAKTINPAIQVIAVGAAKAPAAYLSWKSGELVEASMETAAEGLATRTAFEMPQSIMRDMLDDFLQVSEEEIQNAILMLLEKARTLAEGAGAASLAGALQIKDQVRGKKVAVVISGGNLAMHQLRSALTAG